MLKGLKDANPTNMQLVGFACVRVCVQIMLPTLRAQDYCIRDSALS